MLNHYVYVVEEADIIKNVYSDHFDIVLLLMFWFCVSQNAGFNQVWDHQGY